MSPLGGRLQLPAKVGVDLEHPGRHDAVTRMWREDPHHSFGQAEGNRYSRDQQECGWKKPSHLALTLHRFPRLSPISSADGGNATLSRPAFRGLNLPQGVRVRGVEHELPIDDDLPVPR